MSPEANMNYREEIEQINRQTAAIARIREEMLAELAALEQAEPECECTQCDVAEYDPTTCEYHWSDSQWNRDVRRVEAAIAECERESLNSERKVA
jgi:hypothetical protein